MICGEAKGEVTTANMRCFSSNNDAGAAYESQSFGVEEGRLRPRTRLIRLTVSPLPPELVCVSDKHAWTRLRYSLG